MFKRENLVTLRNVDKAMYDKLYNAVMEIHHDMKAMNNPTASAEDRVIATVSIFDDLERFAIVFSDASKSFKNHTGTYLSSQSILGLKYRAVRLNLSRQLYKLMKDIYPERKAVRQ